MKKHIKFIIPALALASFMVSCDDDYIDPITAVEQGTDSTAPVITIANPVSGNTLIPFTDTTTDFVFQYSVSDDIELGSVEIILDGATLETHDSFLDYRNLTDSYTKNIGLGTHTFTVNATDLSGKTSTQTVSFVVDNKYYALYDGEKAYFPFFAGNTFTELLTGSNPTKVGAPTTASGGYDGYAYQATTDSYVTYPLSGLYSSEGISFTFWYKVNATATRAGIITINDNADNTDENRKQGLRLFREGSATSQTIKMNVGVGTGESWNDGGATAVNGSWVHVGVTVSPTQSKIYFNGVLQRTASYTTPFDFSSSSTVTIGSGAPSFSYWDHDSDTSQLDELRIYNKALTEAEVKATMQ